MIKLSRTDLIKMISAQVLEDLRDEVEQADAAAASAIAAFNAAAVESARNQNDGLLSSMAEVAGKPFDAVRGTCITKLYSDVAPDDVVTVVFHDAPMSFDCTMKLTTHVRMDGRLLELAGKAQTALRMTIEARERDKRVSVIKEKVRKDLIGDLLKEPGGEEVLDAAKAFAKKMKKLLLEQENVQTEEE